MRAKTTYWTVGIVLATLAVSTTATAAPGLGLDAGTLDVQKNLGFHARYAQVWAGPWNEKSGWSSIHAAVDRAADRGIVPVVEWFYWGNDISPHCVTHGCWSHVHNTWKDPGRWYANAHALADTLKNALQGRPGVIVLESEFNKNGVTTWDTFDGHLAAQAALFKQRVPEAKIAVGFGNWNSGEWWRWDRAMAAADYAGLQTMRAVNREGWDGYRTAGGAMEAAVAKLRSLYGKPILVHDLALSTHPDPDARWLQAETLRDILARAPRMEGQGLIGIVYRALDDHPNANGAEYYGAAERRFGLRTPEGHWKPALEPWIRASQGGGSAPAAAPAPAPAPAAPSTSISFQPRAVGNPWWVEVLVDAPVSKVQARVNDGGWQDLPRTSWGTWAKSIHVPAGSTVQFRTWDGGGREHVSQAVPWGGIQLEFRPKWTSNPWWVETEVRGAPVSKVEARVNQGPWVELPQTAWGTWAKSLHAPAGSQVHMRAWSGGVAVPGGPFAWGA